MDSEEYDDMPNVMSSSCFLQVPGADNFSLPGSRRDSNVSNCASRPLAPRARAGSMESFASTALPMSGSVVDLRSTSPLPTRMSSECPCDACNRPFDSGGSACDFAVRWGARRAFVFARSVELGGQTNAPQNKCSPPRDSDRRPDGCVIGGMVFIASVSAPFLFRPEFGVDCTERKARRDCARPIRRECKVSAWEDSRRPRLQVGDAPTGNGEAS